MEQPPVKKRHKTKTIVTPPHISHWLRQEFEEDSKGRLPKKAVYELYERFCHQEGTKPKDPNTFGKYLKRIFPDITTKRIGPPRHQVPHYSGISARRIPLPPSQQHGHQHQHQHQHHPQQHSPPHQPMMGIRGTSAFSPLPQHNNHNPALMKSGGAMEFEFSIGPYQRGSRSSTSSLPFPQPPQPPQQQQRSPPRQRSPPQLSPPQAPQQRSPPQQLQQHQHNHNHNAHPLVPPLRSLNWVEERGQEEAHEGIRFMAPWVDKSVGGSVHRDRAMSLPLPPSHPQHPQHKWEWQPDLDWRGSAGAPADSRKRARDWENEEWERREKERNAEHELKRERGENGWEREREREMERERDRAIEDWREHERRRELVTNIRTEREVQQEREREMDRERERERERQREWEMEGKARREKEEETHRMYLLRQEREREREREMRTRAREMILNSSNEGVESLQAGYEWQIFRGGRVEINREREREREMEREREREKEKEKERERDWEYERERMREREGKREPNRTETMVEMERVRAWRVETMERDRELELPALRFQHHEASEKKSSFLTSMRDDTQQQQQRLSPPAQLSPPHLPHLPQQPLQPAKRKYDFVEERFPLSPLQFSPPSTTSTLTPQHLPPLNHNNHNNQPPLKHTHAHKRQKRDIEIERVSARKWDAADVIVVQSLAITPEEETTSSFRRLGLESTILRMSEFKRCFSVFARIYSSYVPLHWTAYLPDIVEHVEFSFSFARDLDLTLSSCVSIIGGALLLGKPRLAKELWHLCRQLVDEAKDSGRGLGLTSAIPLLFLASSASSLFDDSGDTQALSLRYGRQALRLCESGEETGWGRCCEKVARAHCRNFVAQLDPLAPPPVAVSPSEQHAHCVLAQRHSHPLPTSLIRQLSLTTSASRHSASIHQSLRQLMQLVPCEETPHTAHIQQHNKLSRERVVVVKTVKKVVRIARRIICQEVADAALGRTLQCSHQGLFVEMVSVRECDIAKAIGRAETLLDLAGQDDLPTSLQICSSQIPKIYLGKPKLAYSASLHPLRWLIRLLRRFAFMKDVNATICDCRQLLRAMLSK